MQYLFSKRALDNGMPKENAGYFEFINNPTLSSGIYNLNPGEEDPQKPHLFDEVYFVMGGSAMLSVNGETFDVGSGDFIYVPAYAHHKFHDIKERLTLLVFFSKATQDRAH